MPETNEGSTHEVIESAITPAAPDHAALQAAAPARHEAATEGTGTFTPPAPPETPHADVEEMKYIIAQLERSNGELRKTFASRSLFTVLEARVTFLEGFLSRTHGHDITKAGA